MKIKKILILSVVLLFFSQVIVSADDSVVDQSSSLGWARGRITGVPVSCSGSINQPGDRFGVTIRAGGDTGTETTSFEFYGVTMAQALLIQWAVANGVELVFDYWVDAAGRCHLISVYIMPDYPEWIQLSDIVIPPCL